MIIKSLLLVVVSLLFAHPAAAQFGQSDRQFDRRLDDAAAALARSAEDFANSHYSTYTNSGRNNRNDVEAVMMSQQFSAAARIFHRMVVDRRRNPELRDAYDILQTLARSLERTNLPRNTWINVQRSLSDVGREIGSGSPGGGGGGQFPDTGRGGRMTWRGRVDDDVRITIRGGRADVETIGGTEYSDSQPDFSNSLPSRRVTVQLTNRQGRGEIYIEQQPSRDNDFAVVVRIKDPRGGASDYAFELTW